MQSDFEDSNCVYSMTGYGEARARSDGGTIKASVRTVNHKGTSVKVRGLEEDPSLAHRAEKFIKKSFPRGRIEVEIEAGGDNGLASGELDRKAIEESFDSLSSLADELGLPEGPTLRDLIDLDLLETEPLYKGDWSLVKEVLSEAVDRALEAGAEEGEAIREDLLDHLDEISRRLEETEKMIPEVVSRYKEELEERVEKLLEDEVDLEEDKLEQELALFADKVDVNEELSRVKSHLEKAKEALKEGGVVGKKLEFVRQELQREINTLGAKSKDGEIQSQVIEMKLALEKFKEQSRNLA